MSQAVHHHYPIQHHANTFADVFADSAREDFELDALLFSDAYGMISNDASLSPSSVKKNRRSTGLPGKFPTRWLVTTVFPSFSSHAKGSHVYSYFAETSLFHSLIAARPL